jgi:probable phosphoglycerate mutase
MTEEQAKPARILLIRHGLNDFVKEHRLAGRIPGVHLNADGAAQAAALSERLSAEPIAAFYASPMERAQETAAPAAARHGLPVIPEPGVVETDCGEWAGQLVEALSKVELWRQVQFFPSGFRFPGGESMAEIQSRTVAALEAIRAAHSGQLVAVVSHADPIKLAVAFYMGQPLDLFQRLVVSPASITELEFTPYRPTLVRLNDCAHLPPARAAVGAPGK